jgi:hypothetical protein
MTRAWTVSLLWALSFFSCSLSPGGSTSEGEGRVLGRVMNRDGQTPAASALVRIRLAHFLADTSLSVQEGPGGAINLITDAQGWFAADHVDTGEYAIEMNDGKSFAVLRRCRIDGDTVLSADTLKPTGAITGILEPFSEMSGRYFIQAYGIERVARIDPLTKRFTLAEMPCGRYSLRVVSSDATEAPRSIDAVDVEEGETVAISVTSWRYSKKLFLNTTPSGANVTTTVYNFPVLVRLTGSVFDFSQAKGDGADLRFMKPDGTVLPFEIERWDPAAAAEIWVRVDTLFGNDSTHAIVMCWGNTEAAPASNGAAVFDSAGNAGVWHLNGTCEDATYHARHGTHSATTDTAGIIGRCQRFVDSAFVKIPGLMGKPQSLTLSVWASLDTVMGTGAEVVSVGDAALIRMDDSWHNKGTHGAYCVDPAAGVDSTHCIVRSGKFFAKTGWHHLAYSVDIAGGIQRLYIDGVSCCVSDSMAPVVYTTIGVDTYLGRHGNGRLDFNFRGAIDEARIEKKVRSADWIKLCYMNQRPDDRLVVFK